MEKSIFNQFRLTVDENRYGLYGIHLYKEGCTPICHTWRNVRRLSLYSGAKTFTAMGIGICQDEGLLNLGDRIADFFPETKSRIPQDYHRITIRDALHMASGIQAPWWFSADDEDCLTTDWLELCFREPITSEPGTRFYYANVNTVLLSRVVEAVSGCTLRDYMVPRLFTPLGIGNPQWHSCPRGHTLGASELYLTTEEYSRLGIMMLNGGVYDGRQIVSRSYILAATTDIICNKDPLLDDEKNKTRTGYGYQLWMGSYPGSYYASGAFGQFCIVIPSLKAVVTTTGHYEKDGDDILKAIYEDVVPYI